MSRSYDLDTVRDSITELVSYDFDSSGFEVSDVEGTLSVSARITVILPDGWEFAGYTDSLEIERHVSF